MAGAAALRFACLRRTLGLGPRLLARRLPGPPPPGHGRALALAVGGAGCTLVATAAQGSAHCEGKPPETETPAAWPWSWASDTCALWRRDWQPDWDGRAAPVPAEGDGSRSKLKTVGRVRHLLFIRHGQYDLDDDENGLTDMGKAQSHHLGERLAAMSGGLQKDRNGEVNVTFEGIWSSDVLRARQTAEILAEHLRGVRLQPPDPLLAEGTPAVPYPQKGKGGVRASTLWEDSARIELAFRRYVHRDIDHKRLAEKIAKEAKQAKKRKEGGAIEADGAAKTEDYFPQAADAAAGAGKVLADGTTTAEAPEHVFEIIVCHCNVIRYFVMRALQLPPEAWLRLGGYNTGITEIVVRPNGGVSLVRFGDTGHLPLDMVTFH